MKTLLTSLCLLVATACATSASASTPIFHDNFEGIGSTNGIDGGVLLDTLGYATLGFGTMMYQPIGEPVAQASFSLEVPGTYTDVTLSLSLAILGTWANNDFDISVDGASVFDTTFDNASGPTTGAGLTTLSYGSNLGFHTLGDSAAYDLTVHLGNLIGDEPHTFAFTATDLDSPAALGVDNITIAGTNVDAVPEPANVAMLMVGLAALGIAARRRRG